MNKKFIGDSPLEHGFYLFNELAAPAINVIAKVANKDDLLMLYMGVFSAMYHDMMTALGQQSATALVLMMQEEFEKFSQATPPADGSKSTPTVH